MQQAHDKEVQSYERRIKDLEAELAKAHRDIINNRNHWFEVFGDLEKEYNKNLSAALKKAEQMEMRVLHAEWQLDEAMDKAKEQRSRLYEVETELEEEKGKNLRLRAQLNRDYENSSVPSSKSIRHKKIPTAGKRPEENRVDSRAIRGTAGNGRCRIRCLSSSRRRRKCWMTWISKKQQRR